MIPRYLTHIRHLPPIIYAVTALENIFVEFVRNAPLRVLVST